MKRIIQSLLAITAMMPTTSFANDSISHDPFMLRIAQKGDLELSCDQLVDEATLMRDIISTTQALKNEADFNGNAVTALGAVGSFLTSTVTAGLSLAAAGLVASNEVENNENTADKTQDTARQRRALISGIYQAKSCPHGGMDSALVEGKPPVIYANNDASRAQIANAVEPSSGENKSISYND